MSKCTAWKTPADIAVESALSARTVRRYLAGRAKDFPIHYPGAYWRFSEEEFGQIVADLRSRKSRESQRHGQGGTYTSL